MGDIYQELKASIELAYILAKESSKARELENDLKYGENTAKAAPDLLQLCENTLSWNKKCYGSNYLIDAPEYVRDLYEKLRLLKK